MSLLKAICRWLLQGGIFLVWGVFPGVLLVVPIDNILPPGEWAHLVSGFCGIAVSVFFWRGVYSTSRGRGLIDKIMEFARFGDQ